MSDLGQHEKDCVRFVGQPWTQVHEWMDECFRELGATHRKARHHWEGIRHAEELFGLGARSAALIHVLRDCHYVPFASDYETGRVDALGIPSTVSALEYGQLGEGEFEKLVTDYLSEENKALLILGWIDNPPSLALTLQNVLANSVGQMPPTIEAWQQMREKMPRLIEKFPYSSGAFEKSEYSEGTPFAQRLSQLIAFLSLQMPSASFGILPTESLINPLQVIDLNYANHLQKPLMSNPETVQAPLTEEAIREFAFPERLDIQTNIVSDDKGVSVVSRFRELTVAKLEHHFSTAEGVEIRLNITSVPQYILVGHFEGRYYLRGGIHRAFVLARAGVSHIPCVLVQESAVPNVVGPYPTYTSRVLATPRPPLLIDGLNPEFTFKTEFRQSRQLLRVATEEISIPILP